MQAAGVVGGEQLFAHVAQHGDTHLIDELERAIGGEERVPDSERVLEVKLAAKHAAEPAQHVELRQHVKRLEVRAELGVFETEVTTLNRLALVDNNVARVGGSRSGGRRGVATRRRDEPLLNERHETVKRSVGVGLDVRGIEQRRVGRHVGGSGGGVDSGGGGRSERLVRKDKKNWRKQFVHALLVLDVRLFARVDEQNAAQLRLHGGRTKIGVLGICAQHVLLDFTLELGVFKVLVPRRRVGVGERIEGRVLGGVRIDEVLLLKACVVLACGAQLHEPRTHRRLR